MNSEKKITLLGKKRKKRKLKEKNEKIRRPMLDKTIYPRMRVYTCVCKPRFCAMYGLVLSKNLK